MARNSPASVLRLALQRPAGEATMDFALTEQQELIRKEVAALARTFSLNYWLEKDSKAEYPTEFVKAFADNGWLTLMIAEAYGRAGLCRTESALVIPGLYAA